MTGFCLRTFPTEKFIYYSILYAFNVAFYHRRDEFLIAKSTLGNVSFESNHAIFNGGNRKSEVDLSTIRQLFEDHVHRNFRRLRHASSVFDICFDSSRHFIITKYLTRYSLVSK